MLRPATLDDFDVIYSIYMEESVNPFLSFEAMPRDEFGPLFQGFMRTREVYVYEYEGQVAAAMNVTRGQWRMAHVATLGSIAVHADSHSEGVGSAFLSDMLAKLGSEGIKRVELTVDVDNPKAMSFYEGMGFQREGVLRAYIKRAGAEGYVDDVMMSLLLD